MDGYVRLNTDENGKVIDIWDTWYKDPKTEDYIDGVGIGDYLGDCTLTPNSLLLLTFKVETTTRYSYFDGYEYEDEFIIENQIVLIENYDWEDIEDIEERIDDDDLYKSAMDDFFDID